MLVNPGKLLARRSGSTFNPLFLSPFIWDDPSDLTTLFQHSDGTVAVVADGDPVGTVMNKATLIDGSIQSANGSRPLYKTSGGKSWLQADGVDDYLDDTVVSHAQPFTVVSAWRILAYPAAFSHLWGSSADQEYSLAITPTVLEMTANNFSNNIQVAVPSVGADFSVTQIYNGASSKITITGGATASGNAGASALAGTNLFTRNGDTSHCANVRMYGFIAAPGVLTDLQIAQATAYLATKMP